MVFLVFFYVYPMLTRFQFISILITFFPLMVCSQRAKVRVALASSLAPAMKEIKAAFESTHDVEIELIPGASGTLANQILNGAPFDIFISANKNYSQMLFEHGFLTHEARDLGKGQLVLWSDKKIKNWSPSNANTLISNLLLRPDTKIIAIAQPGLAPYGDAAFSYLKTLNVLNKLDDKLIYGNNLSIANQYIYTKGANVVITSLASKIALTKIQNQHWYTLESTTGLVQSVCLVNTSLLESKIFYEFLFMAASQSILKAYGYLEM